MSADRMVIALRAFPAAIADLKAATSVAGEGAGSIVVLAGEPEKNGKFALDSVRWDEGIFWRGATPDVTPPTATLDGQCSQTLSRAWSSQCWRGTPQRVPGGQKSEMIEGSDMVMY